jgi:hypothetical protein
MTTPTMPPAGGPGVDVSTPEGYLRDMLARYFRPGLVDSTLRTWVPVGLGAAISWAAVNFRWLGLPNEPSAAFTIMVTGAVIAVYYLLARTVERRWPAVGRWLIALNLTRTTPVYVEPKAAPAVVEAVAETPLDVSRAAARLRGY